MTISSSCVLLAAFSTLVVGMYLGRTFRVDHGLKDGLRLILGSMLSLLALKIGFTLSMAIGGYNGRQAAEEAEATAIRTAFLRSDLLAGHDRSTFRAALDEYLANRIRAYSLNDPSERDRARVIGRRTQVQLWDVTSRAALANQSPVTSQVVAGVNEVLTSQQKTRAAWRGQIPPAAWVLLFIIALLCAVLLGNDTRNVERRAGLLLVLPVAISLSFFMIADIDMPGRGIIRVIPVNLKSTQEFIGSVEAIRLTNEVPDAN